MARWTRLVGSLAAMLAALGVVALAADRIFTNPKVEPHLRALFPKAAAFSPLEGTPLHFKAYAADPKTTPEPAAARLRVLDHRPGARRSTAITARSTSWSAWTSPASCRASCVDYDSEPYGYFSVQPPEFAAQFTGKSVRAPFKVGADVAAVSRATITISSATRAIRDSSRAMAKAFLNPANLKP